MFDELVLTNNGTALLTAILNGHVIKFTKIKLGNGATKPSSIATLTDLVSTKQSLDVARSSILTNNEVNIGANLMGSNITEAFNWTEIGIFAKDVTAGSSEVLFSYQYANTAVPIPVGGTVAEMLLDFIIQVGTSANVNISIDSSLIFVTQADMDNLHTTITGETNTAITAAITPVVTSLNNHINNVSNPHSVTKAQVGLGNVDNYGTATTAEATAGSSTSKFMTPARTKEAVTAYGAITDGNVIIKIGATQPTAQSGKTIIWINTAS